MTAPQPHTDHPRPFAAEADRGTPAPASATASPTASPPPAATGPSPSSGATARKARFWDRAARKYAADPIADMAGYEATLDRTRELLAPTHRVLELGCGTGTTALRLAPGAGHYVATDISPEMIAIANEKLAAAPLPQLDFQVVDADAPAFDPASFDVVLAFNLLHLVSDLDATIDQATRALTPGGLLVSKTPCLGEMNPLVPWLLLPAMRLVGKAPPVLSLRAGALEAAFARHGLETVALERHGTRGKDVRPFIVARKPGG